MKTYAEIRGEKPFDWNEFLDKKEITKVEWERAMILSQSWVTCACGNQCDVIPRRPNSGRPTDNKLQSLGECFTYTIDRKDADIAKAILKEIEQRSDELIKELTK